MLTGIWWSCQISPLFWVYLTKTKKTVWHFSHNKTQTNSNREDRKKLVMIEIGILDGSVSLKFVSLTQCWRAFEKKQELFPGSLRVVGTMNGKPTGKSSIDYSKELSKYLLLRWTLLVQFYRFTFVVNFFGWLAKHNNLTRIQMTFLLIFFSPFKCEIFRENLVWIARSH